MKILFAEPRVKYSVRGNGSRDSFEAGVRLGSLYLADYLRKSNSNFEIQIQENRLRDYLGINYSIDDEIKNSDVVAIGAVSAEINDALRILKKAKEYGKTTILGGIFPSFNVEYCLNNNYVDYIVRNEGEKTLSELLCVIENKKSLSDVRGISYKKNGSIVNNLNNDLIENISDLYPAYDLINLREYSNLESGSIYSARGCLNNCSFCSVSKHWQNKYRVSSLDNILDNISVYVDNGFSSINFKDESFTLEKDRTIEILNGLISSDFRVDGKPITYKIKSRIDDLDSGLLDLMKKANVREIQVGIETINDDRLKEMKKGITSSQIKKITNLVLDNGISLNPIFILGYPNQSAFDLENDKEFISELSSKDNVKTYFTFYTMHRGTNDWFDKQNLTLLSSDFDNFNHKRIVSIPNALGRTDLALKNLYESYLELRQIKNLAKYNPFFDLDYIYNENPSLVDRRL
jgi:anaerobic magnesium-protoporphyrin IX monomethyl ester cyclase